MDPKEAIAAQAFLAHHGYVKGLALRHAPLPGVADDIVQQVFVEFLSKTASWDLSTDIRPLLATMTRNISLRLWRTNATKHRRMKTSWLPFAIASPNSLTRAARWLTSITTAAFPRARSAIGS